MELGGEEAHGRGATDDALVGGEGREQGCNNLNRGGRGGGSLLAARFYRRGREEGAAQEELVLATCSSSSRQHGAARGDSVGAAGHGRWRVGCKDGRALVRFQRGRAWEARVMGKVLSGGKRTRDRKKGTLGKINRRRKKKKWRKERNPED